MLLNFLFKLLPFKKAIVNYGAGLAVRYKRGLEPRLYMKVLAELNKQDKNSYLLTTNLGISDHYKIQLPSQKVSVNYYFGTPEVYYGERCVLFLTKYLASSCDAIADIGANWGYHTYFFAYHTAKPIYFFEPNIPLYNNIVMNIVNHNLTDQVTGFCKGIADQTGELSFYVNQYANDISSLMANDDKVLPNHIQKTTIQVISTDDFIKQYNHKNWLLKVDVEAAEFLFLEGASESLASGKIKYLIIELLENARTQQFVDKMIAKGWFAYYLNDYRIEAVAKDDGRSTLPDYNWLFCKENPEELQNLLAKTRFSVITN